MTWGDAMVDVARRSLGAVTSINRRDAYRTYVHLDTEGGWLTGKPRFPADHQKADLRRGHATRLETQACR